MRQPAYRRTAYWTRERVIEGLIKFFRVYKITPTSTEAYHPYTKNQGKGNQGVDREFPSFYAVLKHFRSFRAAWEAAGIKQNRHWEPWTWEEDWFITNFAGIITRNQIAAYIDRNPDAVHRRLYDIGVNTRTAHGWSVHRLSQHTGLGDWIIRAYMERGELPYLKTHKYFYVDPADCLIMNEIDWDNVSQELADAIRKSLAYRMVSILSGKDWRANREHKTAYGLSRNKKKQQWDKQVQPERPDLQIGEIVKSTRSIPFRPGFRKKQGIVKSIYYSLGGLSTKPIKTNPFPEPGWRATVEYKSKSKAGSAHGPRVSIPVEFLVRDRQSPELS